MELSRMKLGPATTYALAVANGYKGTLEEWLKEQRGPAGQAATIEIFSTETLEAGQPAAVEEAEGSTPQARKYKFKVPQGAAGEAATVEITGIETLEPGQEATLTELEDSTPAHRKYKIGVPQGQQGPAGGRSTPETAILADFTLEEDMANGTLIIPLAENPFNFSAIYVNIVVQCYTGTGMFIGTLHGEDSKKSFVFHLQNLLSTSSSKNVSVNSSIFESSIYSEAFIKSDYMWNTTNVYHFTYPIVLETCTENYLQIEWVNALAGATIKVEGVR